MGDLVPVFAAIAITAIGAIGAAFSAHRLRKLGIGDDQTRVNAALRELADVWEEKYGLEHAAHEAEVTAHAVTRADLSLERKLGSQCRTDLDDARSELRAVARRRPGSRA